ncbi:MAG TPA: hypothetical protein VLG39_04825, partial [Nitrospirota bacterium]|nr:hypothetical protein [Nitrospirota bacterium]
MNSKNKTDVKLLRRNMAQNSGREEQEEGGVPRPARLANTGIAVAAAVLTAFVIQGTGGRPGAYFGL